MKPISIIQRFFFTFLSHRNCRENDKTPKSKNFIIFATPVDFFFHSAVSSKSFAIQIVFDSYKFDWKNVLRANFTYMVYDSK